MQTTAHGSGSSLNSFYGSVSGTSFAAPLTAGTAALMLSVKSCLTPNEVEYVLRKSSSKTVFNFAAHPENQQFQTTSGEGRLDAAAALQFVQNWPQGILSHAGINGPQILCTTGNYTLDNVPKGVTINWSKSSNLSIVSGQGTPTVSLSKVGNGSSWVQATVTVACGQTVTVPAFNFWSGPYGSSNYPIQGPSTVCKNQYVYVNTPSDLTGTTGINWLWPSSWQYVSGQGTRFLALRTTNLSSTGVVSVQVNNACGQGSYSTKTIYVSSCGTFAMYPNPASEELVVEPMDLPEDNRTAEVGVYNLSGELKVLKQFNSKSSIVIPIRELPNGEYVLKLTVGKYVATERFSKE